MPTQVPAIQFTPTGVVLPEEPTVLDGVLADMDQAFGGGMNKSLSSPQGQLAQSLTAIIGDKNSQILEIHNQMDPDRNDGRWQDAIGRIYFINRIPGRGTVVTATCHGLIGTIIPAGSIAQDANGYLYASTAVAAIGASGSVDVQFQCQTDGPIACPPDTLTRIYVAVTGWERVTNAQAGVVGRLVESRYEFEQRRRASVALGSVSMVASVQAALWQVNGVVDVYVTENDTNAAITKGATNYSIRPHSLYCCVAGGTAQDIAKAIQSRKSVGCSTVGNTSYVLEMRDGYSFPYPQYTYNWQTPTATAVFYKVQLANNSQLPSDITQRVKDAIAAGFNGTDGGARAQIGGRVYAGRYYAGVQALHAAVQIISISVGFTAAVGQTMVELGIDQLPTLSPTNITVELV